MKKVHGMRKYWYTRITMSLLTVGVLRGGPSSEYDISLKTGGEVLKHLPEKYQARDIFISKDAVWHIHGAPRTPSQALRNVDVVWNALHGEFGEDGKVQMILNERGIPYTGSAVLPSVFGMNKALSKKIFVEHGIKTPLHIIVRKTDDPEKVREHLFWHFHLPLIVKPVGAGSSLGITVIEDYRALFNALSSAFLYSNTALIEEFIKGREATCGVIDDFRGEHHYTLLPVEIYRPNNMTFFDYSAKCSDTYSHTCPGNFTDEEKSEIQRIARLAHEHLGARHYSRSDMIVHPHRGIYLLEINTLPGLSEYSLFPRSLEAVGCTLSNFIDHVITLALERR